MAGGLLARLAHLWVEADVADQLLRRFEAADIANDRHERRRRDEADPGHRHEPLDLLGGERQPGELRLERRDLFGRGSRPRSGSCRRSGARGRAARAAQARRVPRRQRGPTLAVRRFSSRCSAAWTESFARVRERTRRSRRPSRPRSARVCSSRFQVAGRKPASSSSQSVRASTLSGFSLASAMARTRRASRLPPGRRAARG
jgi:hypothetical protein